MIQSIRGANSNAKRIPIKPIENENEMAKIEWTLKYLQAMCLEFTLIVKYAFHFGIKRTIIIILCFICVLLIESTSVPVESSCFFHICTHTTTYTQSLDYSSVSRAKNMSQQKEMACFCPFPSYAFCAVHTLRTHIPLFCF